MEIYNVAAQLLAYFENDLAVAYTVHAVECECADVERTSDGFPSSGPGPGTCASVLSCPSIPLTPPPISPSLLFPPLNPLLFPKCVFPFGRPPFPGLVLPKMR